MRSRSRVIDIMRTVNPKLYPIASARMAILADLLDGVVPSACQIPDERTVLRWFYEITVRNDSEHIRDLALDGLHYWTERI